jgi:hypothetical protein
VKERRRVVPSLVRAGKRVVVRIFKTPVEEEVDEELGFHVEMRVRELVGRGRTLEEARVEAAARFGNLDQVKAACRRIARQRETRMMTRMWWDDLQQHVVFALRQIRRKSGFATVSIFTLALGIGANTAVFSVVYGVLLQPLPYDDPDRLVHSTRPSHPGSDTRSPFKWETAPDPSCPAYGSVRRTVWGCALPRPVRSIRPRAIRSTWAGA